MEPTEAVEVRMAARNDQNAAVIDDAIHAMCVIDPLRFERFRTALVNSDIETAIREGGDVSTVCVLAAHAIDLALVRRSRLVAGRSNDT